MEGYVSKRGKRMGSRVKRFMKLEGSVLSNHYSADGQATWTVNIRDAIITCSSKRNKVCIELFRNKLEFFTDSIEECEHWYEALMNAKSLANINRVQSMTLNGLKQDCESFNEVKIVSVASDEIAEKRNEFGRGFKVVNPVAVKKGFSSDDSDDDTIPRENSLIANSLNYEETPASMIFKQFHYPVESGKQSKWPFCNKKNPVFYIYFQYQSPSNSDISVLIREDAWHSIRIPRFRRRHQHMFKGVRDGCTQENM